MLSEADEGQGEPSWPWWTRPGGILLSGMVRLGKFWDKLVVASMKIGYGDEVRGVKPMSKGPVTGDPPMLGGGLLVKDDST